MYIDLCLLNHPKAFIFQKLAVKFYFGLSLHIHQHGSSLSLENVCDSWCMHQTGFSSAKLLEKVIDVSRTHTKKRKKNQKNLRPPPPPLAHPRVKICLVFLKHYRKTVFDPRQETNFFLYIKYKEKSFNEKTFCKNNRTAPMLKSRKFHS